MAMRQAPLAARRGLAVAAHSKPSHGMNEFPAMPVEVYPLLGVVLFGTGYGIYASVAAWMKEPEHFAKHQSTGAKELRY